MRLKNAVGAPLGPHLKPLVVKIRHSARTMLLPAVLLGVCVSAPDVSARPKRHHKPPPVTQSDHARAVTYVGFYVFRDGSSRIFVNLTSDAPVEVKAHGKVVEYLLKDTQVLVPNNKNPLITDYFGSPVVSAQLVPTKDGAVLRIELRQALKTTHEMHKHVDGAATLYINFPKSG